MIRLRNFRFFLLGVLIKCVQLGHAVRRAQVFGAQDHDDQNLLGEYDFSEEKLRDSIGIRPPPKIGGLNGVPFWGANARSPKVQSIIGDKRNGHVAFGTFVGI